jgi:hypothetical protein
MQYDRTILFPAIRGGYLSLSNWYPHWNAVRVAAGMVSLEFYELKHRALQWMVDPVEDGGLGLDPATAAQMAGHDDGGWLTPTSTPSSPSAAPASAPSARWQITPSVTSVRFANAPRLRAPAGWARRLELEVVHDPRYFASAIGLLECTYGADTQRSHRDHVGFGRRR